MSEYGKFFDNLIAENQSMAAIVICAVDWMNKKNNN